MKSINEIKYNPPKDWLSIRCIDMHTGGEPLRVLIDGYPEIKGASILEKRKYFQEHLDYIRTGLMWEPRGHADMYGAVLSEPSIEGADYDVLFLHNEGYSTMCGHAIIALTKLVYETGLVSRDAPKVSFNVPAGLVRSKATYSDGVVSISSFKNVASFLLLEDRSVTVDGLGEITFSVAFGGAFYAIVDSEALSLSLDSSSYNQLIDYGQRIKKAVSSQFQILHPLEEDLSFLYGVIFTSKAEDERNHSRNVCIFAEGEVDRSATGSGVSARAALHYSKNELRLNQSITIESILGSTMSVRTVEEVDYHGHLAIIPEVSGSASFTGESVFSFDPKDPYRDGFIFR